MKPSEQWQKWEPKVEQPERKDPCEDFKDPWKEWRHDTRWEFLVPVESVILFFSNLFRRTKK